jgi:hypothetical protein
MTKPMAKPMHSASKSTHAMHPTHPMHATRGTTQRPTAAGNSEVDRLNQMSLQSAQQGQAFTPGSGSGAMGSSPSMGAASHGAAPMGAPGSSQSGGSSK